MRDLSQFMMIIGLGDHLESKYPNAVFHFNDTFILLFVIIMCSFIPSLSQKEMWLEYSILPSFYS